MRILLADPPWYCLNGVKAPTVSLGLGTIAGALRATGHSVAIWNGDLYGSEVGNEQVTYETKNSAAESVLHVSYENFKTNVMRLKPSLIGITAMTADFFSARILARIAKVLLPDSHVVIGGVHSTLVPEEVLQDHNIDFAVLGEGEDTICELVSALEERDSSKLASIKGLGRKEGGKILLNTERALVEDLDRLPIASYQGLIDRALHRPVDIGGLISSRGCPYPCTYCASHKLWTRTVRYRSISHLFKEIHDLYESGVRVFRLHDDTFTLQRARVYEFCKAVQQFKDIRWSCDTRIELIDLPLLRIIREAGCYLINVGIESGSKKIQETIKKTIDLEAAARRISLAHKVGIRVTAYFMLGFPSEEAEDVEATLRAMYKLNADFPLFSIMTPYPGTLIWDQLRRGGKLMNVDYSHLHHHSSTINFSKIPEAEFSKILNDVQIRSASLASRRKFFFAFRHPKLFLEDRRIMHPQFTLPLSGQQIMAHRYAVGSI